MKHNYDEPTMQAAIDRACEETKKQYNPSSGTLMLDPELHYRSWPQEKPARLDLLKTALDHLPEPPPPVVDGKTPGQVCHESMYNTPEWKWLLAGDKAACESAASAVLAAFGNKPSQPTEIPWTEWHGGPCPLKNEEVAEWCYEFRKRPEEKVLPRLTATCRPSTLRWTHDGDFGDIIAYRVTKWKEGFGPVDWKARAEKAEAELANWKEAAQVAKWQRDLIIDESTDKTGRILELEKLSTLRPISEAGDVPAGCVRYFFRILQCSFSIGTLEQGEDDTHFADIRLPESPKDANARAHAEFQDELEAVWNGETESQAPAAESLKHTYQFDGLPEPEKPWTPKVGDVVQLRSGGPKMTVLDPHPTCYCSWFTYGDGEFYSNNFPTATLIPA